MDRALRIRSQGKASLLFMSNARVEQLLPNQGATGKQAANALLSQRQVWNTPTAIRTETDIQLALLHYHCRHPANQCTRIRGLDHANRWKQQRTSSLRLASKR